MLRLGMSLADLVIAVVLAYLIGSFPTSLLAGRISRGIDIREHGSGNPGATNVFRVLGWKIGLPVALFDFAKGFFPTLLLPGLHLMQLESGPVAPIPLAEIAVACASVAGHVFPVYTRFRGGKGVATGAGAVFALLPLVGPVCIGIFAIVLAASGYVSLSSLAATATLVPAFLLIEVWARERWNPHLLVFLTLTSLAVAVLHRGNIRRLIQGTERRFDKARVFRTRRADDAEQ